MMDKWPIDSDRQAHEHAVALEERLAYSVTFWDTDELERIADYATVGAQVDVLDLACMPLDTVTEAELAQAIILG